MSPMSHKAQVSRPTMAPTHSFNACAFKLGGTIKLMVPVGFGQSGQAQLPRVEHVQTALAFHVASAQKLAVALKRALTQRQTLTRPRHLAPHLDRRAQPIDGVLHAEHVTERAL